MRILQLVIRKVADMFPPVWGGPEWGLCLLLTVHCQLATAQLFPVQVNPQLVPPYSLKLSDYATTANEKLLLNLLLTDVNETDLQVRLRFSMDGDRIHMRSTDFVQNAVPIHLTGGVPLRLSNLDLRPYFDFRNLEGITPQQYSNPLPDGLYQFCFEVFDWVTGRPLSKKTCVPAFLVLNDPPFLNLPQRGELIIAKNPQNIIFQWTPRHLNATGVQYEFELRELWDTQIDPHAAFLASPNLYQTTTFATTLLYGPGETALLEGKTYGWRVRAVVSNGISETSVFKNNGYSEIFHFAYTGQCDAPKFVLAKSDGTTKENISWQADPDHKQYQVQYRKKGVSGAIWFEQETTENIKSLYFLEPGTTYEFRVGGQCIPNRGYSFSQINTFTTPSREEASNYNCGISPEILITNQKPIEQLGVNDVFTAGDFPVTIQEVYGGNGTFSGWGFIVVPYLADTQIRVGFTNIRINTDRQLIGGVVETAYDMDFATGGNMGVDDIQDELGALSNFVDEIVEAVNNQFDNGSIDQAERDAALAKMESFARRLSEAEETLGEGASIVEEGKKKKDDQLDNEGERKIAKAKDSLEEINKNLQEKAAELGVNAGLGKAIADTYYDELLPINVADKNEIQFGFIDQIDIIRLPIGASDSLVPPLEPSIFNLDGTSYVFFITSSRDSHSHIQNIRNKVDNLENGIAIYMHYDLKKEVLGYKVEFAKNQFGKLTAKEREEVRFTFKKGIANLRKAYAMANAVEDWSVVLLEATKGLNSRLKEIVRIVKMPEEIWDQITYPDQEEYLESFITGLADGVFEEVKNIPLLVSLVIDYTTDEWAKKKIDNAIASIEVEAIIDDFIKERGKLYANNNPYRQKHQTGKDVVAVGTMLGTGGTATLGKIRNGVDFIKEIVERLKNRRFLDRGINSLNWSKVLGKKIDDFTEAPDGYQFYNRFDKKWIRRVNSSNPDTPQLTVRNGEIVRYSGKSIAKFTPEQLDEFVTFATNNKSAKKIMLGKYDDLKITSYIERAGKDYTYFHMGSKKWKEGADLVKNNLDEMWRINKEFIDRQKAAGKEFYFSHNPNMATGSFKMEVDYLTRSLKGKIKKIDNQTWQVIW